MDWFLYGRDLRHEKVNHVFGSNKSNNQYVQNMVLLVYLRKYKISREGREFDPEKKLKSKHIS